MVVKQTQFALKTLEVSNLFSLKTPRQKTRTPKNRNMAQHEHFLNFGEN